MEWLTENWNYILITGLVCIAFVWCIIQKRANAKEWLKWAVAEAEKALGSGTGQLKLRMVYDMFVKQYSWIATFVSFETFSSWVDEALVWLDKQLGTNINASKAIRGE